ncbi:hypothetical protein UFOVP711_46 [uncultured Caudovirales phage]|uniref:Uncharacterized protein n=1 Tax=uncultured Caudovirales phage TaxID=2100421 RepID=A0A6J5NPV0_9CAUD|nr:hypothetical protein UFOVP711_46 [uncultured Caudovirales phage]
MGEYTDSSEFYGAVTAYVWSIGGKWLVVASTRADAHRIAHSRGWFLAGQSLSTLDSPSIRRATQHEVDTLGIIPELP